MLVQGIGQRSGMISFALESPWFKSHTDILSLSLFCQFFYVVSIITARQRTLLMKILTCDYIICDRPISHMGVYYESDLDLHVLLYRLCFIIICLDNTDVTISIRASILQTLGPPSALGTLFLERRGWLAEKLHVKLRCQFLASQYVMTRGFLPVALQCAGWKLSPFCLTSLLSTLLIFQVIVCISFDVIVHVYKYFCDSTL